MTALLAGYVAICIFGLAANGTSIYVLSSSSQDPVTDVLGGIYKAFTVSNPSRHPRMSSLFALLIASNPVLSTAIMIASLLHTEADGAAISRKGVDASKAQKQATDTYAVVFTEPESIAGQVQTQASHACLGPKLSLLGHQCRPLQVRMRCTHGWWIAHKPQNFVGGERGHPIKTGVQCFLSDTNKLRYDR